ncbi:NADPH-dependent FMN reductase [Marinicellulosiphila megalodicopiae]|uniref:NADPH-dependent FMN reductase n=1 Tax=Marinicellulosiphila megalodicopiae TaxID=2724896 RepID=UPI003BB126D6
MKFLLILGSVRDSSPPKPARLGLRIARACLKCLNAHYAEHQFELIDPLDYPFESIFKPHFSYAKNKVPDALELVSKKIQSADGYIMLSPEYNHSMSPALANLLNHFGSSLFSYKPSAIVTYSAGQWGGLRAAVGMRSFLSELGCLPVSAMIHVPNAQKVFMEDGNMQSDESQNSWFDYFSRTFNQLVWWAHASQNQREVIDPNKMIGDFKKDPSERNGP